DVRGRHRGAAREREASTHYRRVDRNTGGKERQERGRVREGGDRVALRGRAHADGGRNTCRRAEGICEAVVARRDNGRDSESTEFVDYGLVRIAVAWRRADAAARAQIRVG